MEGEPVPGLPVDRVESGRGPNLCPGPDRPVGEVDVECGAVDHERARGCRPEGDGFERRAEDARPADRRADHRSGPREVEDPLRHEAGALYGVAYLWVLLDHPDRVTGLGEPGRHGRARGAGSYHQNVDLVHVPASQRPLLINAGTA